MSQTDPQPTDVVFGIDPDVDDQVWLGPRGMATDLVFAQAAIGDAATWGDLRAAYSAREPAMVPGLWDWLDEDWHPEDETTFEPDDFPGFADGDYPPHLGLLVPGWMPDDLRARHCEPYVTIFNGTYWFADTAVAPALVEALEGRGFTCELDHELIGRALGR